MALGILFSCDNLHAVTLIDEDFSSSASNFTTSGGSWVVSGGRYVLSNPASGVTAGVLENISMHDTSVSGDFTLTVTVNITGTTSAWNDTAIIFGYQDNDNYYYVSLNESNNGTAKGVFKVASGSPTELVDITTTIASDTDYNVEVLRSGSSIVVLLDSSQIASTTDSTFTSGQVGIGSYNDAGTFDDLSVSVNDTEAPTTPTGLSSSNVTTSSMDLSWNAATDNVGVTGYKIYTGGSNPVDVDNVTSTTISGLTQNTSYTFTVSAYDAASNESAQSSGVNVTTADGQAPSVPTGFAVSNETSSSVDLDWNASTDNVGVVGYNLYTSGSNPVDVGNVTGITVSNLSPATSYTFSVSAYDAASNESAQSSGVNATTLSGSGGSTIDEDFSGSAGNFTVIAGGTWNVTSGRYVLSSPATGTAYSLLGNISVHNTVISGDFTLSAVVNITGTASTWDDAALVFGFQDTNNYYYVSLCESNNTTIKGIFKVVAGSPTELADITATIASGTDYTLEVQRSGASINVLLDSTQIASVSDSTFTSGKVGFGSYNDAAQFDDLDVTGTVSNQVAAPTFSPSGGTYTSTQSVTISTTTSGATIRYTTDGSTPTSTSGSLYSSAISVSSSITLKAIAYKSGMTDSDVASASYTISTGGQNQYYNLYGVSGVPTFPYSSSLVWPQNVGDADICTWGDDMFAALTITIDDNIPADHSWWSQMAATYDLPLTWFVITETAINGNQWTSFQNLANEGHSIQSHSVTHDPSYTDQEYHYEYEQSQIDVNQNITGQWAGVLAFPGNGQPFRPDIAKDYYLGARGVTGTPNKANEIVYLETKSTSGYINEDYIDSILYGTSGVSWLGNNTFLRGWLCTHFHTVTNKTATEADLQNIDAERSQLWIGTFYDMIRFVQERDTATVTVNSVNTNQITFDLTDWMDDSIYNYPLTVKFRVSNSWSNVSATQNGQALEAWMVTNGGNNYALVKAIPDSGQVVLENSQSSGSAYYVDPSSGSMSNPGTSSQPWSTLEAIFTAGKTFADGDTIYLRNGNHGHPVITEDNTADVTITADSGHNPVVNRIYFNGATHWVLDNIDVYTSSAPPEAPVLTHPVYAKFNNSLVRMDGASSEITISNCYIYSTTDSSSWNADDWNYGAWNGIYINTDCHDITIDGCDVHNTNFGIHMHASTSDLTIINNTVRDFCGDGVRANCSDLLIENNVIRDCYQTNGNHADMIQGFAATNVVIRGNIILDATSSGTYLLGAQGIGCFGDGFVDWTVENNIVSVYHWHGISFYGATNCKMINNTVAKNPLFGGNMVPWIRFDSGSGNYCYNNLTSDISLMTGTTVSNNIESTDYSAHYVDHSNFDFHLKSTSSAIDAGTTSQAPSIDFEGDSRDSNPDVGADEY